MEKDFNLRNIVWFTLILVSAGSVWGILQNRVSALEAKQAQLEEVIMKDIPEIRERVIRLETKINILLEK